MLSISVAASARRSTQLLGSVLVAAAVFAFFVPVADGGWDVSISAVGSDGDPVPFAAEGPMSMNTNAWTHCFGTGSSKVVFQVDTDAEGAIATRRDMEANPHACFAREAVRHLQALTFEARETSLTVEYSFEWTVNPAPN